MDDVEVLKATLNNTIARHMRAIQNYEIEIANLTSELIRLQNDAESKTEANKPSKTTS